MVSPHASQATGKSAPQEVINEVVSAVSGKIEVIGTEVGEQFQALVREANNRHLAVRRADGRLILRISLTAGLVAGISFLMLVPIRRAILLTVAALFVRIYFSVEDNDELTAAITGEERRQA